MTRHRFRLRSSFIVALACAVVLAGVAAACGSGSRGSANTSPKADAVVATVGGRPVHQSDVDLARAEARLVGKDDGAARALDTAIDRELISAEAARLGLSVDPAEVTSRLAAITKQTGGIASLNAGLKKADMTVAQLRASLAAGVLREAVQNAHFPRITAPESAVRAFYRNKRTTFFLRPESVNLGAIVVRNAGIAGNALKRLRAGHPFEEVSKQFTADPEIKANSGHIGWISPLSFPAPLRSAIRKLKAGEVSAPVTGPEGTWVFKAFAVRPAYLVPLAKVRAEIEKGLTSRRRSAALDRWLALARAKAVIVRH